MGLINGVNDHINLIATEVITISRYGIMLNIKYDLSPDPAGLGGRDLIKSNQT